MDYREQLEYIKSHQIAEDDKKRKAKNVKKSRKQEDEWADLDEWLEQIDLDEPEKRRKPKKSGNKRTNEPVKGRAGESDRRRKGEPNKRRRDEPDRRQKRDIRERKITGIDKIIMCILVLSSLFLCGVMFFVEFFPLKYMAAVLVITGLVILYIRWRQKKADQSYKRRPRGKVAALLTSVLFVIAGFYVLRANSVIAEIAVGEESGDYAEEHLMKVTETPFNVYISGIDVYGEIEKESRSDVNIIATINPKEHKVLLTTTPRDYYVTIPGVSGEQRDKLTHAGIYGIDKSMAALANLYDTEIPFYTRVNFTSVIEMVDAMGGVDVESEVAFTTSKAAGTVVDIKEGKNHLNGKEALAFVRERKAFIDGDNQRGKNQQALLTAMIKELVSPMIVVEANELINCIVGNADTNLSEKQIKSLIYAQLDDMKGWEVESVAATGDDSGKQYCYSYSSAPLYVTVPNAESVEMISSKIDDYLQ